MTIHSTLAGTTVASVPATKVRRLRGWRPRAALVAAAAVVFGLVLPTAANAATVLTLTGPVTAGNPNVTLTGTVSGAASTDSLYLCFGDEIPSCTNATAATAGTLVTSADISSGVGHKYAVGNYTARLVDVTAGTAPKTTAATLRVTITPIDATSQLGATTAGLATTLNGSKSTATAGDTWSACFGDNPLCTPTSPDAGGPVTTTNGVPSAIAHTYAQPGTYPTSLTVAGKFVTSTASLLVTVNFADPHALLTADRTSGTGNLPVTFDGSKSVSGANDTWAFCFGDPSTCTQTAPDQSGTGAVALSSSLHNYPAGNYTATLWVQKSKNNFSTSTVSIAVGNSVAAPDGTCSITGVIRTCDLFAKATGSATVGASSIPFWGFTTTDAATPVLGGPKLVATVGEKLAFTVHNQLDPKAGNLSITVPSLMGAPDLVGVAPGSAGASGTFTLKTPGTYIYEAGLTSGGERQVAMGLSGLLVVRPSVINSADSAHCAYSSAVASTDCITGGHEAGNYFDKEKLVVVTELDEKYNADPFGTDTGEYNPTHFFLDGVAYDPAKTALDPSDPAFKATANNVRFDGAPGDTVLLRYADLGLREHSLNLTNLLQTETARDANLLPGSHVQNTEFLNAGQTSDTFVTIPADAATGTTYPLSDAGFHLNNGDAPGLGGMYAVVDVVNGATAADVGPVGNAADVITTFDPTAPNIDNGQAPKLDVTATFTAKTPSTTVASVAWALDGVPAPGRWQNSGYSPPTPGAANPTVTFTITPDVLLALLGSEPGRVFGDHTIWLQATDNTGKPGPAIGAVFTLAMRNPVISALSISPKVTNGATRPNQFPSVSATVTAPSNNLTIPQPTINVDSTKGFPATCVRPGLPSPVDNGCLLTVGMSIAGGPGSGSIVYATFTYTGLTGTTFTGVTPTTEIPANAYQLSAGNTVVLDDVPAGYIAVNGTAAASLPGFVVGAAQACVLPGSNTGPTPADGVDSKCAPGLTGAAQTVFDLNSSLDPTAPLTPLAPVSGFLPAPALPANATDAAKFWIMVRAQEVPSGESCVTSPMDCRWSPWVYYNPSPTAANATADPSTYETLSLVTTGPTTGAVTVTPNPNNGFDAAAGNLGLFDAFNVTATATSQWADISLAEAFLAPTSRAVSDPLPADPPTAAFGQGAEMAPADGFWNNSPSKTSTAFLPLSQLQGLPDGLVRVWVHAKDIAGNWGPLAATDLILDHTAPKVTAAAAGTLTAQDAVTNGVSSGVVAAEWFVGADPGPGNGTKAATTPTPIAAPAVPGDPTTFTITALPTGRKVNVRVLDGAGNWSATSVMTP